LSRDDQVGSPTKLTRTIATKCRTKIANAFLNSRSGGTRPAAVVAVSDAGIGHGPPADRNRQRADTRGGGRSAGAELTSLSGKQLASPGNSV